MSVLSAGSVLAVVVIYGGAHSKSASLHDVLVFCVIVCSSRFTGRSSQIFAQKFCHNLVKCLVCVCKDGTYLVAPAPAPGVSKEDLASKKGSQAGTVGQREHNSCTPCPY